MRHTILVIAATIIGLLGTFGLRASDTFAPPPVQAPGKDAWAVCDDYACQLVTEQKPIKKTVYECREVPFCLHELPKFGHHDCCPQCGCVRFKRVLVKREVIVGYECVTKCVPQPMGKPAPSKDVPQAPLDPAYFRGADLSSAAPVIPAPPLPPQSQSLR